MERILAEEVSRLREENCKEFVKKNEVELANILEKRGVHVEQTEVRTIIAGYTVLCDYSERGA